MRKLLTLAAVLLASSASGQVIAFKKGCPPSATPPATCSTAASVNGTCYSDTDFSPAKQYFCNGATATWVPVALEGGNVATATALSADPADCSSPNFARGINAAGTAQCAQPSDVTGNAATATALAANPTDCSSNQRASAIAASGNLTCSAPDNGTGGYAGTTSPAFVTPAVGDATGTTVMLNGATAGTANVLGIQDMTALGAVTDWSAVRVQSAPTSTNANGVAFGTYSTMTNTSATVGSSAHMVGSMGNVTDTTAGRITMYGVEARADGRSTAAAATHSYVGSTNRALFQGTSLSNSVNVIGAEAFCNVTTDGTTPLANGNCLAVYIPAAVGGNAKYSLYAASDPIFAGGGIDVQNLSDTTITRSSAGHIAVEGSAAALASDKLSLFSATTSTELAGVLSDETGSGGGFVRATAPQISTIELGDPADTTLARSAAGAVTIEGDRIATLGAPNAFTGANTVPAGYFLFSDGTGTLFTSTSGPRINVRTEMTPDAPILATSSTANAWHIAPVTLGGSNLGNADCGASGCSSPSLIIHSPNISTTESVRVTHDGANAVFNTGVGGFSFNSDIFFTADKKIYGHSGFPLYIRTNGVFGFGCTDATCAGTAGFVNFNTGAGPLALTPGATSAPDVFFTRGAAAALQLGAANAASPVAQTLQTQGSRGGTDTNVGGANLTIASGDGTGTGTVSTISLQTPTVGSTGTTAQAMATRVSVSSSGVLFTAIAFASLGTPSNGTLAYCNDCTIANPCAGSGTGAFAKRLNGVWVCN